MLKEADFMNKRKKYKSVKEYIDDQPEDVREKLLIMRSCILTASPGAKELINYGIPAFALTEGGKRDDQIMIAGYRNHVGLYPHPITMEHFKEELKAYKTGKGSVQFPLKEDLPEELIIKMVKYRQNLIHEYLNKSLNS